MLKEINPLRSNRKAGKAKLTISVLLGILTIAFIFNNTETKLNNNTTVLSPPSVNNNISDDFLIGAMDNGWDLNYSYISDTLGFNVWHKYAAAQTINGKQYPSGWIYNGAPGDSLFAVHDNYVYQAQGVLDSISGHNMKALMHRPKIEYLCYGQRSDYQCESSNIPENYWFYSFNDHIGQPEEDTEHGAETLVQHVRPVNSTTSGGWIDNPGFVVKRLKANTEQSHSVNSFDAYRWDYQSDWLIKPRIRIDSAIVVNAPNTQVCKIIALNQNRDTIKNLVIKAINFQADIQHPYRGQYIEEYFFGQNDSTLTIHGAWGTKWLYNARGSCSPAQEQSDTNINRADIQVYWYGNCDMWIDYVRVDNDIADRLFKRYYEDPLANREWLLWEARDIAGHDDAPLEFYIELFEFNQIPCIEYVNHKLDSLSGGRFNVMADQLTFYQYHLPWSERGIIDSPEKLKDMYVTKTGSQQIFTGNPYPLTAAYQGYAEFSQVPSTLPTTNGGELLANITSPAAYDDWLQYLFDDPCSWYEGGTWNEHCCPIELRGVFMYTMKHGNSVSKLCNIPFIALLQAHQVYNCYEVEREPTNEELDVMTNIAVF